VWRAGVADLTVEGWEGVRAEAIAAGWYDSRPKLDGVLNTYGQAQTAYNLSYGAELDKQIQLGAELYAALSEVKEAIRGIEAVTNDKSTEHLGMKAFTQQWYNLADSRMTQVSKDRSKLIDTKDFPGKTGFELEQAKQQVLDQALETAKLRQAEKVQERTIAIERLWDAHKIKTPWTTCKLAEFPDKVKSGIFTFGATGAMDFHDKEVRALQVEVRKLREAVLVRLGRELMASTEETLANDFTASAMTADRVVIESLRLICEDLYDKKMRDSDTTEAPLWSPSPTDIVLDAKQWRKVITAAKSGGWDQESNTGFTDALKAYQEARQAFDEEQRKSTPNPTTVEQKKGLVLGALDEFARKLNDFHPVTKQKFHHPGLIEYREGMRELCTAARVQFG